ncbi:MAG: type 4a pilus biogenesis protein PilO [Candidatus Shapirobacteria bacterium]|jgi:Tfp pilus assembly protein PilO|nr:type 4a pilus biogenesis protein PilO [Candidatus Shapirobacteria bacterium]
MIITKSWSQLRPMYDYIKKQTENEKFFKNLEIGGTFTLIAIFLFFAIMPTIITISSLIGDIKSKEAFIKKVDLKVANIIKAQESYSQVQEKYYLIEETFPSLANYYSGTSNIATIFRDSSLSIDQISLNLNENKNEEKKFFSSYQLNLNGEGNYSSIIEMVKKMLNNRRLVDTTSIQISQVKSDANQASTENVRVNFSSNLYFLPDNNEKK